MTRIILIALLVLPFIEGCQKNKGSSSAASSKPALGTMWTYRYRKFTATGSISESYNITYKATSEKTVNGEKWLNITDSTGAVVRVLMSGSEGLNHLISNTKYLLCKDPGSVGDSYNSKNESGDIVFTMKEKDNIIGVPQGEVTINKYEGIQNSVTKDVIWYNSTVWIAREDVYITNQLTGANYVNTRIELSSIKY